VLDTTELLECVLSHLPAKQIFGVKRVSRRWKDVISRSLGIQEKLFLKLQNKPAELWGVFECELRAEDERMKIHMEKITPDVKPKSCYGTAGGKTFTPVALNPFLQLGKDSDDELVEDKPIWDRARYLIPEYTEFCNGLTFDLNSSLLDTYISDPPCMCAQVTFKYFACPPQPGFHRLETRFAVQTDKPLTIRDVIAETWSNVPWADRKATMKIYDVDGYPDQDEQCHPHPEPEQRDDDEDEEEVLGPASLADIIQQLEAGHGGKVVFDPKSSVVRLDKQGDSYFGPFPIVPTEAEWHGVVDHDKDAYDALAVAIEADKKEREAEWRKRHPPMSREQLEALFRRIRQGSGD
jgi:hypothetical protein